MRNRNFVGREELLALLRDGVTGGDDIVRQALHGLGGVGKTQITTEYAHRFQAYYDVIWWVPADQPSLVRSSLAALAPHMGLPDTLASGIDGAAAAVLDALRRGDPYSRWLLIFDNADQPEDITDVLPSGRGHVLITSRNQRWQAVVDTIAIDVFTRAESVEFLTRRVRGITASGAERLAEALGDLPLALEQAGALQAETGMSVDEYLNILQDHAAQLLAESKPREYPLPMAATWSLSVARLSQEQPEVVELLHCLAFFGPEPIPRDALAARGGAVDDPLNEILRDPIRLSRAIGGLGRYALAQIDQDTRTLHVHRLIQALVRDDMPTEEQSRNRHRVHLMLAAYASADPDDMLHWQRYRVAFPHAFAAEITSCDDPTAWRFIINLVRFLRASGQYDASSALAAQFRRQRMNKGGPDDLITLEAGQELSAALHALGNYRESYELNVDLLDRTRDLLGPEHELTLAVGASYGAGLRARGEYVMALQVDEKSVNLHRTVYGNSDVRTLRALSNLALDHALAGDVARARLLDEDILLQLRAAQPDRNSPFGVAVLTDLVRAVGLCGDYSTACDLGQQGLQAATSLFGDDHPLTLLAAKELSIWRRHTGDLLSALDHGRSALTGYRRILGPDHPHTLAAAIGLANTCRLGGQLDEAYDLASDTLTRYRRAYQPDHPYYHGCAGGLAVLHRLRDQPTEACELSESSLAGLESSLGSDHYYSLFCAVNLASDLAALGETERAQAIGAKTLDRLRHALGPNHPVTLACAVNFDFDLQVDSSGAARWPTALDAYTDVRDQYTDVLGDEHPNVHRMREGGRIDVDFDPLPT